MRRNRRGSIIPWRSGVFIQKFKSLAALAGSPSAEVTLLDAALDAPPEIDPSHVVDTIVQQSPAVRQAQQQVVIAEAKLKDAKREVVPDLQLRAGEQANLETLGQRPGQEDGRRKASPAPVSSCRFGTATGQCAGGGSRT